MGGVMGFGACSVIAKRRRSHGEANFLIYYMSDKGLRWAVDLPHAL
jgi:hypothetical protein